MAYMLFQRLTTAILDGYADRPDVGAQLASARAHRRWLESLEVDDGVKASLVEQARWIEEAFERLEARSADRGSAA